MIKNKSIIGLEDIFQESVNILMLPPREEDWTSHAINIANTIPNSTVFCGVRKYNTPIHLKLLDSFRRKRIKEEKVGLPMEVSILGTITRPNSISSRIKLSLYEKFNKKGRIVPFDFTDYLHLPFEEDSFDLAITQTPNGSDVMLYMYYCIKSKPMGLFGCLKSNSFWVHMTSSDTLQKSAYSYFELLNIDTPEKFENPLLRKVFGRDGWRLSKADESYLAEDYTRGKLVSGSNKWMLYQRLNEKRNPIREIERQQKE